MESEWATCPYERAHRVPRARLQRHLVKCEARHPPLAVCPYNATHRMARAQLCHHVLDCPSRPLAEPPRARAALTTPTPTLLRDFMAPGDPDGEMWDD